MEKDRRGYYGLIVKPTFEQALGAARKPLRIPLPDRSAKWYALSPFRSAILDAEKLYNDYQHATLNFRESKADMPEAAARVRESDAGQDASFGAMDEQRHSHEFQQMSRNVQAAAVRQERQAAMNRRADTFRRLQHGRGAPMIDAEHDELEAANVEHFHFGRVVGRHEGRTEAYHEAPQADGFPAQPQFTDFRVQNLGQSVSAAARGYQGADGIDESYAAMRAEAGLFEG